MVASMAKIFLTGATGYIGGSVLTRLLQHPNHGSFQITALIRTQTKADKIKAVFPQVQTVIGSHANLALVRDTVANSDVVIATADIDNMDATRAILAGLKTKYDQTGEPPVFIHTSGVGCFMTQDENKVWDDMNSSEIANLPKHSMHRAVDLVIANAGADGYVRTYIILPSNIYGLASGPLADAGVQHKSSILLPMNIQIALHRGQAGTIGEGNNRHMHVHINDCADLYVTLYDAISNDHPSAGRGHNGYYIAENGECATREMDRAIAQALYKLGKGDSPEPRPFTRTELLQFFGAGLVQSGFLTGNTRGHGNRSRAIGWNPVHTTKDLLDSALPEAKAILDAAGLAYKKT